jgi:hypothetical protein
MQPSAVPYPLTFSLEAPAEIARWRPFVHWLLVIPQLFVLYVLEMVASVCAVIAWFAILFTGAMPAGLAGLLTMFVRYQTRVTTYALYLREPYPPFTFETSEPDPGDDPPVRVEARPELEDRNRVTVFFRWLTVIPSALVLAVIGIGAAIAAFIGAFAILFTGRWPEGLRTFLVGYLRWGVRLSGYAMLLTDEYPPFSLD